MCLVISCCKSRLHSFLNSLSCLGMLKGLLMQNAHVMVIVIITLMMFKWSLLPGVGSSLLLLGLPLTDAFACCPVADKQQQQGQQDRLQPPRNHYIE